MHIHIKRVNKKVHLEALNEDGASVHIDGSPEIGGENLGFRPMQLLLAGIGGCSTMDIVSILEKQKQQVEDITIDVNANRQADVVPSLFEKIHVSFTITGVNLNENKVKRAVDLSMTKYCSVSKILEASAEISYDFKIEEV